MANSLTVHCCIFSCKILLNLKYFILFSIVATLVSMGAAGVPAGGLVYVIVVLEACGLPTDDIGPILAIEWFL